MRLRMRITSMRTSVYLSNDSSKKATNIVNPAMVTNSTSQDISPQGISQEKHIVALINWEKQFYTGILFQDLRSDTQLLIILITSAIT